MYSDVHLARRLERTEGLAGARYIEAHLRKAPQCGSQWSEIAGVYALYDGAESPITQTFGLGLSSLPPSALVLDELEQFFLSRGAHVHHEISPLAAKEIWPVIGDRGYRPIEFNSVMYRPVFRMEVLDSPVTVRVAGEVDRALWAETAAEGWKGETGLDAQLRHLMDVTAYRSDAVLFLAELDGRAVASGALFVIDGIALFGGASTIAAARGRGAQRALLIERMNYAAAAGLELAMIVAEAGRVSQRNAERAAFRIAYTRVKWALPAPGHRS